MTMSPGASDAVVPEGGEEGHGGQRPCGTLATSRWPRGQAGLALPLWRPEIGGPNEVWALDFMSDQLFDGRPFRILTVLDCHTRESLAIAPRANFRAFQMVEVLDAVEGGGKVGQWSGAVVAL
jgi:transposase InsO family protein